MIKMVSWECKKWTETDKWMYQQFIKWNDYSDVKCHPQYGIGNYTRCAQGRNIWVIWICVTWSLKSMFSCKVTCKPVKQHILTQIMDEIIYGNTLYKFRGKLLNKKKQYYPPLLLIVQKRINIRNDPCSHFQWPIYCKGSMVSLYDYKQRILENQKIKFKSSQGLGDLKGKKSFLINAM